MINLAPNIYKYKTRAGRRYAVRWQNQGRPLWRKGFVTNDQAQDYLDDLNMKTIDAKYFSDRIPCPILKEDFTNGHLVETPKSGRNRRVELSREVIRVLKTHRARAPKDARLIFPGKGRKGPTSTPGTGAGRCGIRS